MTLVIFVVGVLIFFISVYGAVVAGGLRLTVSQLDGQPDLADEAGVGEKRAQHGISVSDISSKEF